MQWRAFWFAAALAAVLPGQALAQRVTVQQPTFRRFSIATTVVAPDRGAVQLGGLNSSRAGRQTLGSPLLPSADRGSALDQAASGVSVSAWIHDFAALDQAVLARAASNRGGAEAAPVLAASPELDPPKSLHAIRGLQSAADEQQAGETSRLWAKARSLDAEGKPGVARIYYRMALRRARGEQKDQFSAALEGLTSNRASAGNLP